MKKQPFLLLFLSFPLFLSGQPLDMKLLQGMQPRNIGPAGMSGRVTAIEVDPENPDILYVGTASGGLWRSEGGGVDWEPLFDSVGVSSIGAIAIDRNRPDVIWVGTGEGNPRNSQTLGAGVYRSIDGGRTWQYMGLKETRSIHRIYIHRDDPNTVFVNALGNSWADSEERGVYRTTDGGQTWEKILYVNDRTGANDLVVDASNPDKMLVSMWEYRRWPWFFRSGGPGSGLYMTLDGGDTWKEITNQEGLPEGPIGKIGLAMAVSNPDIVYALVESKKNALYRSEDGGFTWILVNDKTVGDRPFYYGDIFVDPQNENRLYNVFSSVSVSEDGGKSFNMLLDWGDEHNVHGDHHAWFVHPKDGSFLIDGNDGGLAISRDRGLTWRFVENLPAGQFYHINVDNEYPYNVYGGMQDNGTWRGPNTAWRAGGVLNAYFDEIGFGDGFDAVPERDNNRYGYVMWQGGNLLRVDFQTGAQQWVKPYHPEGKALRFNWNAGIAYDPFDPGTIYYGSQYLHKSTDRGKSWEVISPDLTKADPRKMQQKKSGGLTFDVTGAENHSTILTIAPSPRRADVLWVGTDDGNVQVTQDGGNSWINVAPNIRGVPDSSWVAQVHASNFDPAEAYVVINNYRRGDWSPYLYRTRNYGQTWERLVEAEEVKGYCLSWVQDPLEPKLQFLGTEFGLYLSIDGGESWSQWTSGYPAAVSTYDMVIHPREHDLVIGSFGRAIWVLDDIRPLRELAQRSLSVLEEPLHVFSAPDAYLAVYKQRAGTRFTGNADFSGANEPYGALVTFSVSEIMTRDQGRETEKVDSLHVEIYDENGSPVRQLKTALKTGVNRFSWDLSTDGVRLPVQPQPKGEDLVPPAGHPVSPGVYTVRLIYGDHRDETQVTVHPDPRMEVNLMATRQFYAAWEDFNRYIAASTAAMDNLREAKQRVSQIDRMVAEQVNETALEQYKSQSENIKATIDSLMFIVMPGEDIQGIYDDPDQLIGKISAALFYFNPSFDAPNPAFHAPTRVHQRVVEHVKAEIEAFVDRVNRFFETDWKTFEQEVDALNLDVTKPVESVQIEKQE